MVVTMWPRVYACVCAIASGDENLARSPSYEGKPTSLSRVRRARLGAARGRCARKCSAGRAREWETAGDEVRRARLRAAPAANLVDW